MIPTHPQPPIPLQVWTAAEDEMILRSVEEMGQKWRKIAALLPNRSDDAVSNGSHRLSAAQPYPNRNPNPN